MKRLCPHKIDCEGSDSPIANLTSESVEGIYYRVIGYCCDGSIRQNYSIISYFDAIDGLQRLMVQTCPGCPPPIDVIWCGPDPDADPSEPPPGDTPCNELQLCESVTEDGIYTYVFLPCTIYAESVEAANALAHALACERAQTNAIRLGPLPRCTCADAAYSSTIEIATAASPLNVVVFAGALPTGMTLHGGVTASKNILVDGTPTAPGNYTFSIRAYDVFGNYATRTYTIAVVEITTTELPELTIGTAYSYQLTASGGSGKYQWGLQSGSELPAGLSLSLTGLISGTPTAAATAPVVFVVADTECEELEATAIKPAVTMTAVSQTRQMRWLGWQAFNGEKRRFKKLSWEGTSEHWAVVFASSQEVVRAKYIYEGASEITVTGLQISNYSKNLYQRCTDNVLKEVWYLPVPPSGSVIWENAPTLLKGYCLEADPLSCDTCDSDNLTFVGDYAANSNIDVSDLLRGGEVTVTATTLESSPLTWAFDSIIGHSFQLAPGGYTMDPPEGFPLRTVNERTTSWAHFTAQHDYSATLSNEYTDAEALANAYVWNSNGTTAENNPRKLTSASVEDWFRASLTTVAFTLNCSNLIIGRSYRVEVSLIASNGTITKPAVTFTAVAATHTINGTVPTPAAFQTIMVRYPKISFAP